MKTPSINTPAGAESVPAIDHPEAKKTWEKCGRKLWRHVQTGTIYYYLKRNGKIKRRSLGTTKISEAEALVPTMRKKLLAEFAEPHKQAVTFADARKLYEADLEANSDLAEASKYYRRTRIAALLKSWPALDNTKLEKITQQDCEHWKRNFSAKFDEQNFNNTLGTLRAILERGGIKGEANPATQVKRLGVKPTVLRLPEPAQFDKLVEVIENAGSGHSKHCADLVRFLAFSGCRLSEARQVKWADVDFERGEIRVRNAKQRRTNNHAEYRHVPIIPAMRELLDKLRCRNPHGSQDRVCVIGECEKALTAACGIKDGKRLKRTVRGKVVELGIGIERITHHDLRHLFATRCIEAGVDIPTVSRWLGHVDGGALAMRVYGHLRREHSLSMAQKVTFGTSALPENVTRLPGVVGS